MIVNYTHTILEIKTIISLQSINKHKLYVCSSSNDLGIKCYIMNVGDATVTYAMGQNL